MHCSWGNCTVVHICMHLQDIFVMWSSHLLTRAAHMYPLYMRTHFKTAVALTTYIAAKPTCPYHHRLFFFRLAAMP
jgi:hypothetical protein